MPSFVHIRVPKKNTRLVDAVVETMDDYEFRDIFGIEAVEMEADDHGEEETAVAENL